LCGVGLVVVAGAGAAWNWWPAGDAVDEHGEPT
jgi:hypothetical protein